MQGVTALRTTYEVLNLGKEFHYVGIQFFPGVWQGNQSELVSELIERKLVAVNPVTAAILANLEEIQTVADMAEITQMSSRQLQRTLKKSTGFSPHDFLKVLRLQQSFKQHYLDAYTDQSHFIHSFRKITGYTPAEYFRKFDV